MKMTLMCPNCRKQGEYFKDEKLEYRGYFSFKCDICGEEYIAPKENPFINKED